MRSHPAPLPVPRNRGPALLVRFFTLALVLGPARAPAAVPLSTYLNSGVNGCPVYGDLRICSGRVPSFDGTLLDVDITFPITPGAPANSPLIVMIHGFGNNKHEWQSLTDEADGADKYHWNSHWFARHSYVVLTYTARGFKDDGATLAYQPRTPSWPSQGLPNGTIRLKSVEFELKDTQWLAALVAAAFPQVDPRRVAVTGGSYGGGESWLLASQPAWDWPHQQDPSLPVLSLQVAVPKYGWTDLAYSLAPNGHGGGPLRSDLYESSTGFAHSPTGAGNPLGVNRMTYTSGFFAVGNQNGLFEEGTSTTPSEEGPISVAAWYHRIVGVGDPYEVGTLEDPLLQQLRRGLTRYRSAYYQDAAWREQLAGRQVAIYAIQGWTDDLFTAVEVFRQFKFLKRLDSKWPVALALADVGHPRASNRAESWRWLNAEAWRFLSEHINGSHRQDTTVVSETTLCGPSTLRERITAHSPEALAGGTLSVRYRQGDSLVSYQPGDTSGTGTGLVDLNGAATDPIARSQLPFDITAGPDACAISPGPAVGGYTALSEPLDRARRYVGLGSVRLAYTLRGGTSATLFARVWDVQPDGTAFYVTSGVYRLSVPGYDAATGTMRIPLMGNHWTLGAGHRIRLDLTQVNHPTFRPSGEQSMIQFDAPTLELPTIEQDRMELPGDRLPLMGFAW